MFEGPEVVLTYSCDICGNGYLCHMPSKDTEVEAKQSMPRGGGNITHTREGF